jgi:hypothetical protein
LRLAPAPINTKGFIADLIINIGHDVVEKPPFFMHEGGTQVIHINFNSAQVDEVYFRKTVLGI